MIVLAVNVDQMLGDLFEHRQRDGMAIKRDGASSAGEEPAGQQQFTPRSPTGVRRSAFDLFGKLGIVQMKQAGDAAFLRACADHLRAAARTEQHFECAE